VRLQPSGGGAAGAVQRERHVPPLGALQPRGRDALLLEST